MVSERFSPPSRASREHADHAGEGEDDAITKPIRNLAME